MDTNIETSLSPTLGGRSIEVENFSQLAWYSSIVRHVPVGIDTWSLTIPSEESVWNVESTITSSPPDGTAGSYWGKIETKGIPDVDLIKWLTIADRDSCYQPSKSIVCGLLYRSLIRAGLAKNTVEKTLHDMHVQTPTVSHYTSLPEDLLPAQRDLLAKVELYDEGDGVVPIYRLAAAYFSRLSDKEKGELLVSILPLYEEMCQEEYGPMEGLLPEIVRVLGTKSPESVSVILRYIVEHVGRLNFRNVDYDTEIDVFTGGYESEWNYLQTLFSLSLKGCGYAAVLRELIQLQDSANKRKLLALAAFPRQYTKTLNTIRELVRTESDQEKRTLFEKAGKELMGIAPDASVPFHKCIADFYAAVAPMPIDGDENPYLDPQAEQMELISNHLKSGMRVLDMGAGDGRLTRPVLQRGVRVISVDPDYRLLEELNNSIPIADRDRLEVKVGSMDRSSVEDGSIDLEFDLGRVIQHTTHLGTTLKEKYRVLKEGGILIFDFGDKEKGMYLENRKRYARAIQGLWGGESGGLSMDKILSCSNHTVDGPRDDQNFLNRQVFGEDEVVHELVTSGFEVLEVRRKQIFKDTADENIYIVARKVTKKSFYQITHS